MPSLKNKGVVVPDDDLTHEQIGEELESLGAQMTVDETVDFDLPEGNYTVAPVDVETMQKNPSMLTDKKFGSHYRGRLKGMDELVSTATVRQMLKGILKGKKLTVKQLKSLSRYINNISRVRLPTGGSGYKFKKSGRVMQHPSGKKTLAWGTTGKNHGDADRVRRVAVLKAYREQVKSKNKTVVVLKAVLGRAISHTLNTFTAPLTAKNLERLNTVTSDQARIQSKDREWVKRQGKYLGLKQNVTGDTSFDREWAGDDSSVLSEDRYFDSEFESEVKTKLGDLDGGTTKQKKTHKTLSPVKIKKAKNTSAVKKLGKQSKVQKQMKKQQQKLVKKKTTSTSIKTTAASLRPKRASAQKAKGFYKD